MLPLPRRQLAVHTFAALLVVGIAALVFVQTRSYGLLGMDSYPIILTSRVGSLVDFWGNFSERLMDGLFPGKFYRPLLNFTFAADYALWGLEPSGYQFSNVIWFAMSGLALYVLLVSRPHGRTAWSALAGLLFFLLHPLHFEAIPYPPRRPEFLCLTFMLLALASENRTGKVFRISGALATLLALASKETALILPALVFAQHWICSDQTGVKRWLAPIRSVAFSAAVVAIYIACRIAVLGGMGGHRQSLSISSFEGLPETVGTLLRTISSPQQPGFWTALATWAGLSSLLVVGVLFQRLRHGKQPRSSGSAMIPDFLLGVSWVGLLAVMVTASGRLSPWYLVVVVAGFAITVAGVVDECVLLMRRSGTLAKLGGAGCLVAVTLWTVHWQVRWSPLVRSYDVWQVATDEYSALVEQVRSEIEAAADGEVIRIRIPRRNTVPDREASMYRGVVRLGHYSVQAWAGLEMPERNVRVLKHWQHLQAKPAKKTEVVVVLDREPKKSKPPRARGNPALVPSPETKGSAAAVEAKRETADVSQQPVPERGAATPREKGGG